MKDLPHLECVATLGCHLHLRPKGHSFEKTPCPCNRGSANRKCSHRLPALEAGKYLRSRLSTSKRRLARTPLILKSRRSCCKMCPSESGLRQLAQNASKPCPMHATKCNHPPQSRDWCISWPIGQLSTTLRLTAAHFALRKRP